MLPVVGKVVLSTTSRNVGYRSSTDTHGTDAQDLLDFKPAVAVPCLIFCIVESMQDNFCYSLSASHIRAMPDVRFGGSSHANSKEKGGKKMQS
jgi:hypothetical protein